MNRVNRVSGWALAGLLLAAAGCTYDGGMTQKSAMTPTLYERLGGKGAITAVVEDFVGRVAAEFMPNDDVHHSDAVPGDARTPATHAGRLGNAVDRWVCHRHLA